MKLFNPHALYLPVVSQKPFKIKPSSWCALNQMIIIMKNIFREHIEWCQKFLELCGTKADVPTLVKCTLKPTSSRTYSIHVGHWLELCGTKADVPTLVKCMLKPTSSRTYSIHVGHWNIEKNYDLVELTELEKQWIECTILCVEYSHITPQNTARCSKLPDILLLERLIPSSFMNIPKSGYFIILPGLKPHYNCWPGMRMTWWMTSFPNKRAPCWCQSNSPVFMSCYLAGQHLKWAILKRLSNIVFKYKVGV